MSDFQDAALICLNGHAVNDSFFRTPSGNQNYCNECGSSTIHKCSSCETIIKGHLYMEGVAYFDIVHVPNFCSNCGESFPWLTEKINAAKELTDEMDELTEAEREKLKASIDDLVKEGPRTELAATRFKKIISKVGLEVANGMRSIIVDVASETGKKLLGLS